MAALRAYRPDPAEAVKAEARNWVLRIASGDDVEVERACAAWRAADPEREAAFRIAWRAWQAIGETPIALNENWREEAAALQLTPTARLAKAARSRTFRFGLPTALAASIAALLLMPQMHRTAPTPPPELRVATAVAETRTLALDDGSRVTVGAHSGVDVAFAPEARRVILNSGQAYFEVAHDPARPFIVLAGNAEIRVTGTKFDVTRIGDDVRVSVLEGRVEVRRHSAPAAAPEQVLTAGQRSVLVADAGFRPAQPAAVPAGEWRTGRLYYADAPLSEILADAQRYSAVRIRVADDRVANMRLTASFRANDMNHFVNDIEAALPVTAEHRADGSIVLTQR